MKFRNTIYRKSLFAWSLTGLSVMLVGCSDFLEPEPLSFFEPDNTFNTESGLSASMSAADVQLRNYWISDDGRSLAFELRHSELAVDGNTSSSTSLTDLDWLKPTNILSKNTFFWNDAFYSGVKFANTITSYIDDVEGLDEDLKNEYIGRAYFHRAFRYYNLVFQFNNVPLLTKVPQEPKMDYRSTTRKAILDLMTHDMEFAVQHVPDQKDMDYVGMVNKGACRMLLTKLYLATGQWEKAKLQADTLIDYSGYRLMTEPFGTFVDCGEPETWTIKRNVIWDLHRPENKLIGENKELIFGMPDRGTGESFSQFLTMRNFGPYWCDQTNVKAPDGKPSANVIARNSSKYNNKLDFARVCGRGIAAIRPTYFATHTLWQVNGQMDKGDLRHSAEAGNWFPMDSLKYNDPESTNYGKSYAEVPPIITTDSVRTYFDFPLYKIYLKDVVAEDNMGETNFKGATKGSIADWYVFRLAEAYLLRAEAKFYLNDEAGAAEDVNAVRRRAHCEQLYTTANIGDIMDERARELYLEEFRHVELSRVSYCLALSGRPDEWGNTYDVNTFDKQEGFDEQGGSYWYQRLIHYNNYYRFGNAGGTINANKRNFKYRVNKHNLYYPIPDESIKENSRGTMWQNFGYDGYDENIPLWDNWEDAVADED